MSSRFLYAIAFVGGIGALALVATLMIDHLELFGLRQVWDQLLLHLGFLLAFWATPG